jgi:hypothetical protein
MSTREGADVDGDARDDKDNRDRRGERIGVGGGDDSVTRIQLAARWAESYGVASDSLGSILRRFRAAYEYLDAVTHGVEPPDLDREQRDARPAAQPTPAPQSPPASYAPPGEAAPSQQQPEPRPWG